MTEMNLWVLGIVTAVVLLMTPVLLHVSCWLYNKVNGLAPPGLGRSDSRNYTLVTQPDLRFYHPPKALSRYDSSKSAAGGVALPGFFRCIGMGVAFGLASTAVGCFLWLVFSAAANATGSTPGMSLLLALTLAIPLNLVILAGLISLFLPTTFWRGTSVALVYFLVLLTILAVVVIVAFLIGLAVGIPLPTFEATV